jgi:ferric enterobactin receptor
MRGCLLFAVAFLVAIPHLALAQCRVEGTLRGTDGLPMAGVSITLEGFDGRTRATTTTDEAGQFAIGNIKPGLRVKITAAVAGRPIAVSYLLVTQWVETVPLEDRTGRRGPGEPIDVGAQGGPAGGIAGVVRFPDGRPTPRAVVTIRDTFLATMTDEAGRFVFDGLAAGITVSLTAGIAGYADAAADTTVPKDSRALTDLTLRDAGFTPAGRAPADQPDALAGSDAVEVRLSQMDGVPSLARPDLLRGAQFLPGMTTGLEESAGVAMRNAAPGQSLVTIDGFTIYDGEHALGTIAAFNQHGVSTGSLTKTMIDATQGGRIGGALLLSGERPVPARTSGSVELGLPGAGGSVTVPVAGRGSLFVAARASWPASLYDQAIDLYAPGGATPVPGRATPFATGALTTTPESSFLDLHATLDVRPTTKDRLTVTLYRGRDDANRSRDERLTATAASAGSSSATSTSIAPPVDYGVVLPSDAYVAVNDVYNSTTLGFGAVWSRSWSRRLTTRITFGHSQYSHTRNQASSITSASTGGEYAFEALRGGNETTSDGTTVEDLTVRGVADFAASFTHVLTFGGELAHLQSDTQMLVESLARTNTWALSSSLVPLVDRQASSGTSAVFVQDAWRLLPQLTVTPGFRLERFGATAATYVEPSVRAAWQPAPRIDVRGGWGISHQMMNTITREDLVSGDRQFWALADGVDVPVLQVQQLFVGADVRVGAIVVGVNGYFRDLENLTLFAPRLYPGSAVPASGALWHHGTGNAQGGELFLQHAVPANAIRIAYTASRSDEMFPTLEDGVFPSALDRRHQIAITDAAHVWRAWTFSGAFVASTGRPYTPADGTELVLLPQGAGVYEFVFAKKNSSRLPFYHRLDVSVRRDFRATAFRGALGATVFNVLDRKNVWYREYQTIGAAATANDQFLMGRAVSLFLTLRF